MNRHRSFLTKLGASLALLLCTLKDFSQVTFASMGSTGGGSSGSSGSGGGFSSGGDGGDSFSSGSGSDSYYHNYDDNSNSSIGMLPIFVNGQLNLMNLDIDLIVSFVVTFICYLLLNKSNPDLSFGKRNLFLGFIFVCGVINPVLGAFMFLFFYRTVTGKSNNDDLQNAPNTKLTQREYLLEQNMTIQRFRQVLRKFKLSLTKQDESKEDDLTETYSKAQYLYGQLIRQYISGNHDTRALREYLAPEFYNNMVSEIKRKADSQTIDDVVIDKAEITRSCHTGDFIIVELHVTGKDNEAQANANFDSSFKRQAWTDYVIFEQYGDKYKIANIVYGEHFHLNGKDYNNQSLGGKYDEHDLRDHEHDMFK